MPIHLGRQHVLSRGRAAGGCSLLLRRVMASRPPRQRGFTLVELMVTLFVAAILTVIAVPSFNTMINTNRLTTAADAVVGALSTARMDAIKNNAPVQFCSNSASSNSSGAGDTLGTACASSTAAVYAINGTTTTEVLAPATELQASSIALHGTVAAIRFNGQGLGFAPGSTTPYDSSATGNGPVADICSTALSNNNHMVISMAAGSIITTSTSSGACP